MQTGTVEEIRIATEATVRGFMTADPAEPCRFVVGGAEVEDKNNPP